MTYAATILADSLGPSGARLTTFLVRYPRLVHAEMMTHRAFSRNAASSRAIPVTRMIREVWRAPYVPEELGANRPGMQAGAALAGPRRLAALLAWHLAARAACVFAWLLARSGAHKQWANRVLEPFAWISVIVSATDWSGFFLQRCHPDAQPEMQRAAGLMRDALRASRPRVLRRGEWHLPMHLPELDADVAPELLPWVCAGRVARVSYATHDGRRDPAADYALAARLATHDPMHASPFEHVARALATPMPCRNFRGFEQLRHALESEGVQPGEAA